MRGTPGIVLVFVLLAGCSQGPKYCDVSGTVTLDGQSVEDGDILFADVGGVLGPDAAKIKGGHFQAKVKEGKKRIEINAPKIIPGGAKGAGGEPVPEETIPTEYNTKSTLTEEVTVAGPNEFKFTLQSRKK